MASYASYKKIDGSFFEDEVIPADALNPSGLDTWCVKWIYGSPVNCTQGCCCLWTVPTGVKRVTFELWGSGGNGTGACSCSRCHVYIGAQGGYYNTKTIGVEEGWTYTICAGGVYPCNSRECTGCSGCSSYVNGCNLSNFCAIGGNTGIACNSWSLGCFSDNGRCCMSPGTWGGDFGMGNHQQQFWRPKGWACHCHGNYSIPSAAPFIGTNVMQTANFCWIRCGCWTVPFGHGGQNAMSDQCGSSCCGQGGTGGPGLVKITYV
jgi:hypothetical protein